MTGIVVNIDGNEVKSLGSIDLIQNFINVGDGYHLRNDRERSALNICTEIVVCLTCVLGIALDPYSSPSLFQQKAGRVFQAVADADFKEGPVGRADPRKYLGKVAIFAVLAVNLAIGAIKSQRVGRARI